MKDQVILRTARFGGFNKSDVLTYVDELNSKIDMLKGKLEKFADTDINELENYKKDIENLKEKITETEGKLSQSAALYDEIVNQKNALEKEKNIISEENFSLKKDLEALKKEVESVEANAKSTVNYDNISVDASSFENEIADLKSQLENSRQQALEMSGEISKLTSEVSEKSKKIDQLTLDNEELRLQIEGGFSIDFDMGALFTEAQSTAKKIIVEAKTAADKLLKNAKAESKRVLNEAEIKAETTEAEARKNSEAVMKAASKLRDIFGTEMETLSLKLSAAAKEAENIGKKLGQEITETNNIISEDVKVFLNNDSEVNVILNGYANDSKSYNNIGENKISNCVDFDDQNSKSDDNKKADEIASDSVDDIIGSFAIDPVSDNEDEEPIRKKQPALGFDLGDLAKLAEEAEKEF